jgi:heme/copper-type cytochrome/quinol oxidase subunit 4
MTAPQITVIVLVFISLLNNAYMHGKPKKEGKHNFFHTLFAVFLWIAILLWGNFFN